MAEQQEHRTKPKGRVRIKSDVTHMYRNARAYNEAIVKAQTYDDLGYPLIYVEWDKNHWAYSGEEDGWAMEAHFEPVEEEMPEDKDLLKALADLVQNFQGMTDPHPEHEEDKPTYDGPSYADVLKVAYEDAKEGDAFIVLVARPEKANGVELIKPHIYMHSKRDDAALMLDACMADAAAQTYMRFALEMIRKMKEDGETSS